MNATVQIDDRQFKAALNAYMETTKRSLAQVLNQRAYNVAGRTMDSMKPAPGGEQAQRTKIKTYMDAPVSTRIRMAKSGKNKGKFKRRGSKANQLARVNLIVQARRAKKGLPGLYGAGMRSAEGKFKQAAQVGVGFLKSPFIAVVRGLLDYVKFRGGIKTSWGRISVWPGSKGYGTVNPANPGINPAVVMKMNWNTRGHPGKVNTLTTPHLQAAFNAEAAEIMAHVQRKMQQDADRVNARKT